VRKKSNFYYLLPGQGRNARKRHLRNMIVAVVVGLLVCGLFTWLFYIFD
jgi:hypothetical protein